MFRKGRWSRSVKKTSRIVDEEKADPHRVDIKHLLHGIDIEGFNRGCVRKETSEAYVWSMSALRLT